MSLQRTTFEQVQRVILGRGRIATSRDRSPCLNVGVLANSTVPYGVKSKGDRMRNGRVLCFSRKLCV
jgi:hypothetical protein